MFDVSVERLEEMVGDALDTLPLEFVQQLDNVVFRVEETSLNNAAAEFRGVPVPSRRAGPPAGRWVSTLHLLEPAVITLYRASIAASCASDAEMAVKVSKIVKHELGTFFGISEARIAELGY